ncbi:MAG: glycosyltransferase, partial [Lachnospiraceae bacterium]|nr:glycosyltransferase [Lachnospiraceae bacterium]
MEVKEKVFFHIVVVSYNAGPKLRMTLENIQAQEYPHFDVTVRDGGSTDGSIEEVYSLIATSKNIRLATKADEGIYDAMNLAVREIFEEEGVLSYVLFLNCGDRFYDEQVLATADKRIRAWNRRIAMRTQLSQERFSADICYGDTFDRTAGQIVKANPVMDDFACYRHLPCHQSVFYSLQLLKEEPFDCRWKVRADYEQFLRMKYRRHAHTCYLKMTIADYEGKGYSETAENRKRSEQERKEIISMYLPKNKILKYDAYRTATLQPL